MTIAETVAEARRDELMTEEELREHRKSAPSRLYTAEESRAVIFDIFTRCLAKAMEDAKTRFPVA